MKKKNNSFLNFLQNTGFKKAIAKLFFYALISVTVFILVLVMLVMLGVFGKLPGIIDLKQIKNNMATEIISVDNEILGRYYYQNRTNTALKDIPKDLINALIVTEDIRFFNHKGVDFRSTMRVIVKSVFLFNKNSGGGSTISQQLAKNLYPRKNNGFLTMPVTKTKEIIIARRIEKLYTKEEILELYLNTVSFGENSYGIETAALIFYNKKPSQLRLEESAMLVGLLKANTSYNPRKSSEAAIMRRNTVIDQLVKYNYLKREKADSLKKIPVRLKYRQLTHDEGLAPYFREYLRHELTKILENIVKPDGSKYNLYSDGLKIYTTLNAQLQEYAEQAAKEHLTRLQNEFDKHWKGQEPWKKNIRLADLQIRQSSAYQDLIENGYSHEDAIMAMKEKRKTKVFSWNGDKDTLISPLDSVLYHFKTLQNGMFVMNGINGDVLVWIGGNDYKYFKFDHVTAKRQAGSTFKPVVYASALEQGVKPCDFFRNDSIVYEEYDNWCPKNSDHLYGGFYSMKGALVNSVNTVSAKLIIETGIDNAINLAHRMGISSELPEVPSLALGSGEVTLFEMVKAYSIFINDGYNIEPRIIRRIEDTRGNVIFTDQAHEKGDSILSALIAQEMLVMMKGVVDRGTAYALRSAWGLTGELAGKTGTTQNQTDGWFIAMNPRVVVGTWVGGDSPHVRFRNINYGQGSHMALPVTGNFLRKLYADPSYSYLKSLSFNIPEDIYHSFDCKDYNENAKEVVIDIYNLEDNIIQNFIRNIFKKKRNKEKDTSGGA